MPKVISTGIDGAPLDTLGGLGGPLGGLEALQALLNKPEVKNIYYHRKSIRLDGYKFVECRFDACDLQVEWGNFELIDCVISQDCTVHFGATPARILKLYNRDIEWVYRNWPGLAPERDADGRMTIR